VVSRSINTNKETNKHSHEPKQGAIWEWRIETRRRERGGRQGAVMGLNKI
jgi:hypothetical protein